ncbi:ATP-dependent endonuclease [Achromobacter sp. MYb9]|uniref:ATP-dependent nuclease n=1 Tax=Achromobacter sp. MYb9 TaxID=1827284 RepID=UPI000CFD51F4|nr:ATP-dependent endonuclease [Achromobacter sp. MYb9]PQZ69329.1 ATP-dependent endonuclease [Achromobacter sp. MYb9]
MKIICIEIKNFRLLKNFSIELEQNLSLVIGKNNSGKTSFLAALDKFLNSSERNKISYDDFNVDLKDELVKILTGEMSVADANLYEPLGLKLRLHIKYEEEDDLGSVENLIMSLDPADDNIILEFSYEINRETLLRMLAIYNNDKVSYDGDPTLFLKDKQHDYFGQIRRKSVKHKEESVFIDLNKESISLQNVLSFKSISAKRNVTNKENDKTLSAQTSQIYKRTAESLEQEEAVADFKKELRRTDGELSGIYKKMFAGLLDSVSKFGGIKGSETHIKIASTLQHRELLDGNTTVLYSHDAHDLPEHFNGLGYMNLISMIFDIEMLMASFRRALNEKPAALNLLFIEEPEAHTHPQMQYVFIKNIKSLLQENRIREDGLVMNLQTVITTHSSHIVAESDFDDVKYLKRIATTNGVDARSLKSLKEEYSLDADSKKHYKFLKQYLTLNRAELFFADKVIFVEGDTERILLPAMMRKLDQEFPDAECPPLLSQYVSVVEVGAHAQIFEKFINFIGVKALVITDIDSGYTSPVFEDDNVTPKLHKNGKQVMETNVCLPNDPRADHTANSALVFYHQKARTDLSYFLGLQLADKVLSKTSGSWVRTLNGQMLLVFQSAESGYHGRSFEDAFFALNKDFLGLEAHRFPSLAAKWFDQYVSGDCDALTFAAKAVGSKPSLAIEILLNSAEEGVQSFANWKIPAYIREGLEWLRKQ